MSEFYERLRVEGRRERVLEWVAPRRIPTPHGEVTVAYLPTDKRPPDAEVQLMRYGIKERNSGSVAIYVERA